MTPPISQAAEKPAPPPEIKFYADRVKVYPAAVNGPVRRIKWLLLIVVLATSSAVLPVELMVFPAPCTLIVPPPVALKPMPVLVVMTRPPPVKLMVAPVLLVRFTAVLPPVLNDFELPLNVIAVLLELLLTKMPVPPSLIFPERLTLPPVLLAMFTE